MTERKHTPGPWAAEPMTGRGAWIKAENGTWTALSCGDTDLEAEANARLIAAAPELLAAVKALEWSGEREWSDGKSGPACPWCDAAQGEDLHLPSCPVGNAIAAAEPQS